MNIRDKVIKGVIAVYFAIVTVIICYFASNTLFEDLWENERFTIVALMAASLLLTGILLMYKEKRTVNLMVLYHFIVIVSVVTIIMPAYMRPYIFLPMFLAYVYNIGTGLICGISICSINMFTCAETPEFLLISITFIVMVAGCLTAAKKNSLIKELLMFAGVCVLNIGLQFVYGVYCRDWNLGYDKPGYPFKATVGIILSIVLFIVFKFIREKYFSGKTSPEKFKEISSDDSFLIKEMYRSSKKLMYHSKYIANLSAKAAIAIGADDKIAYAGGMLHDIGKIAGANYVQEGVKICDKYGLPVEIKKIIIEHNIKNRLPKSKESAIVMLADTAVSAVEYLKVNNKGDVDENVVFENAIIKRLKTGALNDSGISIEEFCKIKDVFIKYNQLITK